MGVGVSRLFPPPRLYRLWERGRISSGEGKWVPILQWKLDFIGREPAAGTRE
jgi:hypothetical protein